MIPSRVKFKDFVSIIPEELINYKDNLLNESADYLSQYEFYASDDCICGLSPENNLHIYTKNTSSFKSRLTNFNSGKQKLNLVFSYSHIIDEVDLPHSFRRDFTCYTKSPVQKKKDIGQITKAEANHQNYVNQWYTAFNAEEGASWNTPQVANNSHRFYLNLSENDSLRAAVANHLVSNDYFWFGRLWTSPEFRNQGLGTMLLDYIEGIALLEKKDIAFTAWSDNKNLERFYVKRGYSPVSTVSILKLI